MKTVKELLDSYEEAIAKILNSQEYRTGEHNNRYVELKDLEKKQQTLISKITDEKDLFLYEWQLDLKLKQASGKARVVF